ncbi:hypothetical protein BOTNAR_0070g00290 [Botryotinia narcissicola]|uniref:Uncharacterized protein n=1 Tax=Botryotinia narcissicola TaxID=278944 RepID=A0A4Z1IXC0_9HELO|nr:hypothetical protein BOTNAR_0070g00290 [Botryotinia narcissicola]
MEKFKRHSTYGKATCEPITLSKSKRDGNWQSAALKNCLPTDGSILHDEHSNISTGNNMVSWPSIANHVTPRSAKPITIPYLPTEIINHIISRTDDLESLKNWALVSWAYNDIAERILWSNITINTAQFYDPSYPSDGQDPLRILRHESHERRNDTHLRPPWMRMGRGEHRVPSIVSRLPKVKNFALRTVWDVDSRDLPQGGSREDWTIREVYGDLFPMMENLYTIRIDGEVNRKTWDLLLALPSLRELRIWRTTTVDSQALLDRNHSAEAISQLSHNEKQDLVDNMVLNFRGLSRLTTFEIGLLSPLESAALGAEVRESNLEVLHIAVTRDNRSFHNQGQYTLARFWASLVPNEIDESSPLIQNYNVGFPASMRELVLEDDAHLVIAPPKIVLQSFRRCRHNLTRFYFDFLDETLLSFILKSSSEQAPLFPRLTHLHLQWPESEKHSFEHPRTMTKIMLAFIESHKPTLQSFQLLNAAEDNRLLKYENPLNKALKGWMTIKEIRLDSEHTPDHYANVPRGQEWTRPADFLSVDGGGYWGEDLRRARLDRFNITNIDVGFKSYRAWHNIKVLVLNPKLLWNYGLLPDPHDQSSPRLNSLVHDHLLGMKHFAESECENKELAEKISRKMGPNLRVLSIRDCRFWIPSYGKPIWHLRDALADPEQSRLIKHVLDQKDWDFLSERATTDTQEAANTATFLRNDIYSPSQPTAGSIPRPVSRASIISDTITEPDLEHGSEDEDDVMNSESEDEDEVMNSGSEDEDEDEDYRSTVSELDDEAESIHPEAQVEESQLTHPPVGFTIEDAAHIAQLHAVYAPQPDTEMPLYTHTEAPNLDADMDLFTHTEMPYYIHSHPEL